MRILFSFLLIFMSLGVVNSQTSVIDQELNDYINSLGVEEMMDVNIILKSKIDSNTLGSLGMRAAVCVGAVDSNGNKADFSSQGPVTWQAENDFGLIRPDISAPGVSIQSCSCVDALAAVTKVQAEEVELVAPVLTLTRISSDSVRLNWNTVAAATSYNIYHNDIKIKNVTTNTCIVDNLIYNYTDKFKVTSAKGSSESEKSNEVKKTKGIGDFFVIDYENYSLKFTIKKLSVKEVSVACYIAPTANVELYMPNVATTKDNRDFSVVEIDAKAFFETLFTSTVIPDNVIKIGTSAFEKCSSLKSVSLSNNVITITDRMFYSCKALRDIKFPENLKYIRNSAFFDCDNLVMLNFPNTLKQLYYRAFSNCGSLKYISLPKGLETIANEVFINCKNLEKVISKATTIPKIVNTPNENASFGSIHLVTINDKGDKGYTGNTEIKMYVPCDVIDEYKKEWSHYEERIFGLPRFITDGYWSDENNWTCLPEGGLAACTDVLIEAHAIIKSDEVIEIETFTCTSNGQITIEEGGQIIHDFGGGNVNISKTIAPYVVGDEGYLDSGWYILSSPFVRTDVAPLLVNNYELFRYDEPTYNWENVKNAANNFVELERGRGYIYANANATTLKMRLDSIRRIAHRI